MLHDSILTARVGAPILIVEDNQTNALILRSMLGKHGYSSLVAVDGHEGVEMSRTHRPRLVLMDLQMPRLDGFSAASKILASGGDAAPPIVAVTASVAEKVREACLAAGFSDVISKPIMIEELMATVRRLMPLPEA
jgi:CheY-like chemotaxis protein